MMKKLLLLFALFVGFISTQAQDNPFAEYGYTPKIATLSQGKYNETFDNDTLVQIGSILYNTKSKQIVAFVQIDTMYSEATLEPDIVSRWLSPDPLASEFPSYSPYNFVVNNPILFVDPDGKAVKPSNESAAAAFHSIVQSLGGQKAFGLKVEGKGKNAYYTTDLNWSIDKFARKSGLEGEALSNAIAVFKVLKAEEIVEIAVVSAEGTQSNVENTRNVQTNNSDVNSFMVKTDKDNNLSPLETQSEINALLNDGSPKGDGFGFFPEENNSTVTNYNATSIIPEKKPLGGILIINNQSSQGDFTYGQSNGQSKTDGQVLQSGINAVQDEVK
mgnify:CR=1 FL=1